MEKLEAVQKVLRFSDITREWVTGEHSVYFDDFDEHNVNDYEAGGYGDLARTRSLRKVFRSLFWTKRT